MRIFWACQREVVLNAPVIAGSPTLMIQLIEKVQFLIFQPLFSSE